jgi:hypothetical protein
MEAGQAVDLALKGFEFREGVEQQTTVGGVCREHEVAATLRGKTLAIARGNG